MTKTQAPEQLAERWGWKPRPVGKLPDIVLVMAGSGAGGSQMAGFMATPHGADWTPDPRQARKWNGVGEAVSDLVARGQDPDDPAAVVTFAELIPGWDRDPEPARVTYAPEQTEEVRAVVGNNLFAVARSTILRRVRAALEPRKPPESYGKFLEYGTAPEYMNGTPEV